MITNHYGKFVDSSKPVTGVLSHRQIAWEWADVDICLTCREIEQDIMNHAPSGEQAITEIDNIHCNGSHIRLWGDWNELAGLTSEPKLDGEFAAIIRESVVQIIYSKTLTTGALCSPCYPGQVDLGSRGDYLAYTLPADLLVNT